MSAFVSELYIYPIKGLPGLSLRNSALTAQGLLHDRSWMLIDEAGVFLSQRSLPILSQFRLEPTPAGFMIEAPDGLSQVSIPFYHEGKQIPVQVWEDAFLACHFSDDLDLWFSHILSKSCRLVCIGSASQRSFITPTSQEITLSFADACPILLVGKSSLQDLNARLPEPIQMDRFRPNIIVAGLGAFEEHDLGHFNIGGNVFQSIKSCARCSVITINQQSGRVSAEPLKTLSTYRQNNNKVYFGEYIYCTTSSGIITVGDKLF